MNKIIILLGTFILAISFLSCSGSGDSSSPSNADLPIDEINDEININDEFDYSTVKPVAFNLELVDSNSNPISKAVLIIYDGNDDEISRSVSDSEGNAQFVITIKRTEDTMKVVVQHPDYIDKILTINNADELSAVNRTLYFQEEVVEVEIADSDNDGVSDEQDEFPNDARYVTTVSNSYTLAFEDLYPNKGDADFNDLVVRLAITEYINSENKISKIVLSTKVLASGAGYQNAFGINILGERHMIFANAKTILDGYWNSRTTDIYHDTDPIETVIEFDVPVDRSAIASMPYDPFMIANNIPGREVHLPFVNTEFTGQVLDSDGFPWAVLVPDNWQWPYENSNIFQAYPGFQDWYESDGTVNVDWYTNVDERYLFEIE